MHSVHRILLIFMLLLGSANSALLRAQQDSLQLSGDTLPEIQPGVIVVQRPLIRPFVQVDYKLYLAKVTMVEVDVPAASGIAGDVERDRQPLFDTAVYSKSLERVYPPRTTHLSKVIANNLSYTYAPTDTPQVDTVVIGLWIAKNGKIRQVFLDTAQPPNMSPYLFEDLGLAANKIAVWNNSTTGGGYMTRRKFLKPSQFVNENYYCEMRVIVASFPMTPQQLSTGARYSNADAPR